MADIEFGTGEKIINKIVLISETQKLFFKGNVYKKAVGTWIFIFIGTNYFHFGVIDLPLRYILELEDKGINTVLWPKS